MLGRRESLSSQLKKQLLQKIDDKVYLPGQRIPSESDLCAEFGVSRTVVREAVASLRADGVLKSRQGIGVFLHQAAFPVSTFRSSASSETRSPERISSAKSWFGVITVSV